jgi:hypothetical protein
MQDVIVSKTYKAEDVWEAVAGCGFAGLNYWINFAELDTWLKPCDITLTHTAKDGEDLVKTTITPDQLGEAVAKVMNRKLTHCGNYPVDVEDYDGCFADLVLQTAIFDDIIFG